MSEPNKDKELKPNTKGKEKEVITDSDLDDRSDSTDGSKTSAMPKVCMDAIDYFTKKAQGIAINESVTGKRRKRAPGGIKRAISLKSELNVIGMRFDGSDSEPSSVDAVAKGKGKVKEEITDDVFSGSDTDSDEACKRMKLGRKDDGDGSDDDGAGVGPGPGAGAGTGTHTGLPSMQGVQVAGK